MVEAITAHRGFDGQAGSRREELQLYVKWFDEPSPIWQPWKDFHNNAVAHLT